MKNKKIWIFSTIALLVGIAWSVYTNSHEYLLKKVIRKKGWDRDRLLSFNKCELKSMLDGGIILPEK